MTSRKKIVVVMPAYNAAKKIISVFERIPKEIWGRDVSFIIVNDGSMDDTAKKISEIKSRWGESISVTHKPKNEGYARAQKSGFTRALQEGAEIIVLLHSDGQYAPEVLGELLAPLEAGSADIVQGSRMINKRDALKGGMPFYKFIANIVLSTLENLVYGLDFTEYHSGYMLYSKKALETIPFTKLSDTFHFDGEMLLVGAKKGLRVRQIPIPTLYADEVSYVKGIKYGFDVIKIMIKYLLGKYDFPNPSLPVPKKKKSTEAIVLSVIVGVFAIITIVFGYTGYSLHGYLDSAAFIPPAVNSALGYELKAPLSPVRNAWSDPTGQGRYLWFPPLFPLAVSAFISRSSPLPPPQQALFGAGIIAVIAVLLAAFVFYKIATLHGRKFDYFGAALICALLAIALREMWYFMARPEAFESIFLLAGFLVAMRFRRLRWLISGFAVLLGLLAATHPFGAILFVLVAGLFFSFFYEWRRSVLYLSVTCFFGLAVFVLVMQLSPYGIVETLAGVWHHSQHEIQRLDTSILITGFIKSSYAILYGIMAVLAAVFYANFYKRFCRQIKAPFLFVLFNVLIAVLVLYFIIWGAKTYYALLFSFFIFPALVYCLVHIVNVRPLKYMAILFLMLFAALSIKPVFAFPSYIEHGVTIPDAREEFALVRARHPNTDIVIGYDLWVLTENYERMHGLDDLTLEQQSRHPFLLLLHQAYSYGAYSPGPTPPPMIEECPLHENYFADGIPTFLGITVSGAMPGYGFAVYECR